MIISDNFVWIEKFRRIVLGDLRELFSARKFSVEPELRYANRITQAISSFNDRWPIENREENEENPVFIFSAGWRAGSTLLQRLILSSKEVALWGEPLGNTGTIARLCHSLTAINGSWPPDSYLADRIAYDDPSNEWVANYTPPMVNLRNAHRQFMMQWFGVPANETFGMKRWGIKEVRLTVHHAIYFKWLFPAARFVFICRNPNDSYRSWKGNRWRDVWPSYYRLSPFAFSRHWRLLVDGFTRHGQLVDAMFIKFEDMVAKKIDLEKLASHIQVQGLDGRVLQKKVRGPAKTIERLRKPKLSFLDRVIIRNTCGPLMKKIGY